MRVQHNHVPLNERTGRERVEIALQEAEQDFQHGRTKFGVASLNHALWIALTADVEISELEARGWFNRIERAAGVWEQEL